MQSLNRVAITLMAAVAMILIAATQASAADVKPSKVPRGNTSPVYAVEQPVSAARVESVVTDPRGAVTTTTKRGPGWLLHYGTKRDGCARPDATSVLRVMCVGW